MNNIPNINNTFGVQILVNGNKCKQYNHQGKIFIQANAGSEYTLEIKNNYWKRILAVSSVDGLNVLTGKTASEEDTGYIIGAYSSEKIKGFRISDTEWALFKFGYKFNGNTYAQSKEDGSEKNCGVLGFRFFYEDESIVASYPNSWPITNPYPIIPWPSYYHWHDNCYCGTTYKDNVNYTSNTIGQSNLSNCGGNGMSSGGPMMDMDMDSGCISSDINYIQKITKDSSYKISKKHSCEEKQSAINYCASVPQSSTENFDMGTCWGKTEHSKVQNVSFERGCLAQSFDIYYASRESLISMGVPIHNTLSTNLPQSFPNKYCTPPKGWNG